MARTNLSLRLLLALGALAVTIAATGAPSASAFHTSNFRWAGRSPVVTYNSSIGSRTYRRGIRSAVRAWNRSGINVHFKAVAASKADLHISAREGTARAGCETFSGVTAVHWLRDAGATEGTPDVPGTIELSAQKDMVSSCRFLIAEVVAHELGHAIGLDHETSACAIMNPVVNEHCSAPKRGYWRCRLLERDDLRGAQSIYGGHFKVRKAPFCRI